MTNDTMKKSTIVHEKETLAGLAMALIAAGVGVILLCLQVEPIVWEKMLAGLVTIGIGFIMLYLRGYLKLNRWSHVTIIDDKSILSRLVSFLETRSKSE